MPDDGAVTPGAVVFDRYRIEEWIGAGGMGVVWRATDLLLDQPVALKRVAPRETEDEPAELARARALREAKTAARLRHHPHVVAIYDTRLDQHAIWLVLEYLPSASLAALRRFRLPLGEIARIGAAVADALAAGHAEGIVHRDVTPGNVLVARDGRVKLTDFGISHLPGHREITRKEMISGTIAYLAPEVAGGAGTTPASDVFSLGSTLYAVIEGRPPFGTDDNALRLLNAVRTGIIPPPTSAGPLAEVLARLLELDPATRPDAATARDLLHRFATRADAATEQHPPPRVETDVLQPERRVGPPTGTGRRRRIVSATLVLLAVVALGVTVVVAEPWSAGGGSEPVPERAIASSSRAVVGDPSTADPCSLMDPTPLSDYGQASLAPDFGHFEECAVTITVPDGGYVDTLVRFDQALPPSRT